ncbi:hypothetical protein [Sphingomonas sp. MMS24-J13]|uniref:hypothetical protein n=1 Tax=Sphingomonas sp. MMS24-J13 TaxID=3238686 RepID=UPI00384DA5C2
MRQQHTPLRSSLTAIAAVLALSSTAAFAQSADQAAPDPSAPTIAAPPPPVVSAAPATDASAPAEPTASLTAAPVEPSAPVAAPMATRSTPVIHTPDADASARASQPTRRSASVKHAATTTRSTVSTTKSTTPAPAPAPAPVAKAAPAPEPTPAPALVPATPPAAATTATTRTSVQNENDQMLEVGGAIGLGVIVLGAGAFLLGRRRRREEDEDELILATEPTETTVVAPAYSPSYAAAADTVTAAPTAPVLARADDGEERMVLDNGFDLSRFGRHVRAAYRGPTEDNPSHSLRKRLAHARFFDLRERQAIERGEIVPEAQPIAARNKAPVVAKDDGQIVVRPGWRKPSRLFGTAFQR